MGSGVVVEERPRDHSEVRCSSVPKHRCAAGLPSSAACYSLRGSLGGKIVLRRKVDVNQDFHFLRWRQVVPVAELKESLTGGHRD